MLATPKPGELDIRDRLALLFRESAERRLATVLVFEGGGLGAIYGAITRLTQILDPRRFRCTRVPVDLAASRRRPFLLEYWRPLPAAGDLWIVHGGYYHKLALWRQSRRPPDEDRLRSVYEEINDFERTLGHNGYCVIKIFCGARLASVRGELRTLKLENELRRELRRRWEQEIDDLPLYESHLRPALLATNTYEAGWFESPGLDERAQSYTTLEYLIQRLEERLQIDSRQATADFDAGMARMRDFARKLSIEEGG